MSGEAGERISHPPGKILFAYLKFGVPMSTLAERMAADLLEAQKFSRKHLVLELGLTAASVSELEDNVDTVEYAIAGGKSADNIDMLTRLWGAFLGEVLIHATGASWTEQDGRPAVQGSRGVAFPHDHVRRRLVDGTDHHLGNYFTETIQQL